MSLFLPSLCYLLQPETGECCGNNICEAGEDETCADCAKTLSTTWATNNGSVGNVFKVTANNAVNINAFKIHGTNMGTCQAKVWARAGDFAGFENSSSGWTLLQDVTVAAAGSGSETVLPDLTTPYAMAAGSMHSFHVWTG